MSYLKRHRTRRPPQSAPLTGSGQAPNSAGGFVWAVDHWTQLRRFLVLGSEGGSYYASERKLTRANAKAVERRARPADPRQRLERRLSCLRIVCSRRQRQREDRRIVLRSPAAHADAHDLGDRPRAVLTWTSSASTRRRRS